MSTMSEFEAHNATYVDGFSHGGLPATPSRQVAVVTCMDARIDIYRALGLKPGQAHVLRNAGGVITDDVIRSLTISQQKLGTREIVVIHHTKCGMENMDEAGFADELAAKTGVQPPWPGLAFADVFEDTRQSVARLAASAFIEYDGAITGYVYDVDTGMLEKV